MMKCSKCGAPRRVGKTLCMTCLAEKKRIWRLENHARDRATARKYRHKDIAANRERNRASYERCIEKRRAEQRGLWWKRKRTKTDKDKARSLLTTAVYRGKIEKPTSCSDCGVTGQRIDGHHADYSKPFDVEWLCTRCHGKRHRKSA